MTQEYFVNLFSLHIILKCTTFSRWYILNHNARQSCHITTTSSFFKPRNSRRLVQLWVQQIAEGFNQISLRMHASILIFALFSRCNANPKWSTIKIVIVEISHCTLCRFEVLVFTEAITLWFTGLSVVHQPGNKRLRYIHCSFTQSVVSTAALKQFLQINNGCI